MQNTKEQIEMAKPTIMVKEYKGTDDFQKEAQKLAKQGWTVTGQSERSQRAGCLRFILIGPLALIFHPKSRVTVTYSKTA